MIGELNRTHAKWILSFIVIVTVIHTWMPWRNVRKRHLRCSDLTTSGDTSTDWKGGERERKLRAGVDWSKIEKRKPPPASEMHDKWIVVTTIAHPTDQVKKLSKITGWRLIVVADTKTPKNWK